MNVLRVCAKDIFDPKSSVHYTFYSSISSTIDAHTHDFYEIFLVTSGRAIHHANGSKQILYDGSIVFIRPDDLHYYSKETGFDCSFINIAFPCEIIDSLFAYLGPGFPAYRILDSKMPPIKYLMMIDKNKLSQRFDRLNTMPVEDKNIKDLQLKSILTDIMVDYIMPASYTISEKQVPKWFSHLLSSMSRKENFTGGVAKIIELSGKTHEHLCRAFKKYIGKTPTTYINEIRLNYAANLLTSTDKDIITVALDSGFNNLSHFNHMFKKNFKMTPSKYRKHYGKNSII